MNAFNFLFQSQSGADPENTLQYTQGIGQTQAVAATLTAMSLDKTTLLNGVVNYQVHRTNTGVTQVGEFGYLYMFLNPDGSGSWDMSRETKGSYGATTDVGISFQIDSSGQAFYTIADWPGAGYTGWIRWQFTEKSRLP